MTGTVNGDYGALATAGATPWTIRTAASSPGRLDWFLSPFESAAAEAAARAAPTSVRHSAIFHLNEISETKPLACSVLLLLTEFVPSSHARGPYSERSSSPDASDGCPRDLHRCRQQKKADRVYLSFAESLFRRSLSSRLSIRRVHSLLSRLQGPI